MIFASPPSIASRKNLNSIARIRKLGSFTTYSMNGKVIAISAIALRMLTLNAMISVNFVLLLMLTARTLCSPETVAALRAMIYMRVRCVLKNADLFQWIKSNPVRRDCIAPLPMVPQVPLPTGLSRDHPPQQLQHHPQHHPQQHDHAQHHPQLAPLPGLPDHPPQQFQHEPQGDLFQHDPHPQ